MIVNPNAIIEAHATSKHNHTLSHTHKQINMQSRLLEKHVVQNPQFQTYALTTRERPNGKSPGN